MTLKDYNANILIAQTKLSLVCEEKAKIWADSLDRAKKELANNAQEYIKELRIRNAKILELANNSWIG